ncbi:MAG: rod shape-determining protein [Acidobacteriota bacterium]
MADKNNVLYVGIDLGTSRSAVSTANNQRHVIESYVGWPTDMVARKVLKKEVVIGKEAVDNRTMVDLHRPLERGLIKEGSEKDLTAVREILRHLLHLSGADGDREVRAVVGVPARAMQINKQQLRNTLIGEVDGLMIVSEPFAVAYGLEALMHSLIIDSGAGTTDFCIMLGRMPTEDDQRTLTNAGDSIDANLFSLLAERHPQAQITEFMVRQWKEEHGFVGNEQKPVRVTVPMRGRPQEIDITAELKSASESIVDPIVETMRDLLPHVEPEFQEKVRNNVILSGGTSQLPGLRKKIQDGLEELGGGKVQTVKDPIFAGSDGCLAIALDAADEDWDRLSSQDT